MLFLSLFWDSYPVLKAFFKGKHIGKAGLNLGRPEGLKQGAAGLKQPSSGLKKAASGLS